MTTVFQRANKKLLDRCWICWDEDGDERTAMKTNHSG